MSRRSELLIVFAVVLSVIGAVVGAYVITGLSATKTSVFSAVSSSGVGLVGQPVEYEVELFSTEPYMGPYNFHWEYGDGSAEDGSNITAHIFTNPGLYTPHLLVSGKDGWSTPIDLPQVVILASDSLNVTILSMDLCDWNATHEGDLCLNFTIWNNAAFPLGLYKRSFSLHNSSGDMIAPLNDQTAQSTVPSGGNVTWTIFYPRDASEPVSLSYLNLLEWTIDIESS